MKFPWLSRELLLTLLLSFAAFASVTNSLQIGPLLTALTEEFGKSESTVGQITSVNALIGTVVALLLAPWLHYWPMRRWLRLQFTILLVSVVVLATAQTFETVILARILSGIGAGAMLAVCFTAAAEITTNPALTSRAVAIVASGTTVATLAGIPILALIRESYGWRWASAFVAIPMILVLIGTRWMPGTIRQTTDDTSVGLQAMTGVLKHRPSLMLLTANLLMFVVYFGWVVYVSAYAEIEYAAGAAFISVMFLTAGVAELGGNAAVPRLARRYSATILAVAGFLIGAFALIGTGWLFSTTTLLLLSVALLNFAFSFMFVGAYTALIENATGQKATVLAIAAAATGLGSAIGSFLGGELLDALGDYEAMFQVLGVVLVVAAVMLLTGRQHRAVT